ncbi:MAG: hypothetical protein AAGK78_08465, partial [Planctomycetota bacterium]
EARAWNGGNVARDFFTFTLTGDQVLTAINVLGYDDPTTSAADDGNTGFHGLIAGDVATIPGSGFDNIGGVLVNGGTVGSDIFLDISNGGISGGTGSANPLPAGTYTYVGQQTGPQLTDYRLGFVVSVIPEPAAIGLVAPLALALRRRRA